MSEETVVLSLQPRQTKALTCPANEMLYGGAAGGGKSHLMRVMAIRYCLAVNDLQAYLFRRTYGELRLNHMEGPTSFPALLAPLVNAGKVSVVDKEIRFHETGARIHLCHLQYSKSLMKYQGAEMHLLLMDELTHFTEAEYRYLRGRVRIGTLEIPDDLKGEIPRIMSGTNPGGQGHNWVKKMFVDNGEQRIIQTPKKEGNMRRVYIPARLSDNPALTENDPDYIHRLEGLGDAILVKALKDGDWNIVAGAMFGNTWRKHLHEMNAFPIPIEWPIWTGMDDGFAAPAACYWMTQNPDIKTIYVIAELYRTGMLAPDFAARIKDIEGRIPRIAGDDIVYHKDMVMDEISGIMDSAAFSNTGQAEISRGNQMKSAGIKIRPAEKWPGSRIHRVQNFHKMLAPNARDKRGFPGIRFFKNCRSAIRTIPTLPRDDKNVEDVDTHADDHAFDAVTYGLQWKSRRFTRKRLGGI